MTGVATPGYRVNPPSPGQIVMPAPGTPGGPPVGGQPYYQLPPPADRARPPTQRPALPCRPSRSTRRRPAPYRRALRLAGPSTSRRLRCRQRRPAGRRTSVRSRTFRCLRAGELAGALFWRLSGNVWAANRHRSPTAQARNVHVNSRKADSSLTRKRVPRRASMSQSSRAKFPDSLSIHRLESLDAA